MTRLSVHAVALLFTLTGAAEAQRASTDTIVRRADRPLHPGVATLVEELSIGVEDGPEEYMLGEVADVALAKDGSLFVFDRQVPVVRHYDASGRFLRSVGRSGSGPGEYRSVSGIATTPDGRLLVWDTGNWRINVYAASGDALAQWTTPSGMSGGGTAQFSRALFVDTSGMIIMRRNVYNSPTVWPRFHADGTPADTIHEPRAPAIGTVSARAGNVSVTLPIPFAPRRFVAVSPLGFLVAGFPSRYAFEIHQQGRAVVSVQRDVKSEPVSRSERTEGRQRVEERMRQTDPGWTWNGPDIPENKPLYHGLHVGLDGRIWILLTPDVRPEIGGISGSSGVGPGVRRPPGSTADQDPPKPTLYDVFEPDGSYLGQVQVPAGVSAAVRQGDRVWGVAIGDDDVPRLKRYRIAWKG